MSLIDELAAIVGKTDVLLGDQVSDRPAKWGSSSPCEAVCIVRPQSTRQISAILQLCHERGQAVVTQGGMTGLVEGGVAGKDELVLSLERMNRIEEISHQDRTLLVQAGTPLQAVQERAEEEGFLFPLDFGSRGTATIGGAISTNAGGNRVIRYGMTRNLVLGLETVLADGTVLSSLNRMLKNNAGYDLKQLFIGAEGTLGVVTRAVLRIFPRPRSHNLALLAARKFRHLPVLLDFFQRSLAGTLSAFEVMWKDFYDLVVTEGGTTAPMATGHAFYVLVEALGSEPETHSERFESALLAAQEEGLIVDGVIAMSKRQRDEMWEIRDGLGMSQLGPIFGYDVSLRIQDMEDYVELVETSIKTEWPGARFIAFGHLADGNLHFVVALGKADSENRALVDELVYSPLARIGGSVSAEHGIGLMKRAYLSISRTEEEIRTMRRLKLAFDPNGILNPNKVFLLDESS